MKHSEITNDFIILNKKSKKLKKNFKMKKLNSNNFKILNQKEILKFLLKSKIL